MPNFGWIKNFTQGQIFHIFSNVGKTRTTGCCASSTDESDHLELSLKIQNKYTLKKIGKKPYNIL